MKKNEFVEAKSAFKKWAEGAEWFEVEGKVSSYTPLFFVDDYGYIGQTLSKEEAIKLASDVIETIEEDEYFLDTNPDTERTEDDWWSYSIDDNTFEIKVSRLSQSGCVLKVFTEYVRFVKR